MAATCLLHSLETCHKYYFITEVKCQPWWTNLQIPLATLLIFPKPDDEML